MKKFTENDIFINTIKVYPKVRFFTNNGQIYYNDTNKSGVEIGDFLGPAISEIELLNYVLTENGDILLTEAGEGLIIEE